MAFSVRGTDASLENIARQAGVGIGTLYRHFPTREHLVEAVYRQELQNLADAADVLSEQYPPDVALEEWMRRFVGYIAAKRGMASSLKILTSTNAALFADGGARIQQALETLRQRAACENLIRKDMETGDLLTALSGIYSMPDLPDWQERAHRLIAVLMDGLRAKA